MRLIASQTTMGSAFALFLAAALNAVPAPETRGVWIVRTALTSPQSIDAVVDRAHEAGLNSLFVQVRGRGDAFYASQLVSRSDLLAAQPASFDPLARAIARADRYGMKVHAWVNVLLAGSFGRAVGTEHIVSQHPEWLMVPRSVARQAMDGPPSAIPALVRRAGRGRGDVEGYFLSPSAPGVAAHLEAVVRELMRTYPVDGVHFDFIRYPNADFDYSRVALEGFTRQRQGSRELLAIAGGAPVEWAEYRRAVLTNLTIRLSEAAREERPGIVVSAAVVPDPGVATVEKFQAWPAWIQDGILDALCPMIYTESPSLYRHQAEVARSIVPSARALWAGIGSWRISPQETVDRVWDARAAGASGIIVFSHVALLNPGAVPRLRDGAFASGALDPRSGSVATGGRER